MNFMMDVFQVFVDFMWCVIFDCLCVEGVLLVKEFSVLLFILCQVIMKYFDLFIVVGLIWYEWRGWECYYSLVVFVFELVSIWFEFYLRVWDCWFDCFKVYVDNQEDEV